MAVQKKIRFLNHLWDKESGLGGMFFLLAIMHFIIVPVFSSYASFMVVINVFWMLLLFSGIFSLAKDKKQGLKISIIPTLFVLFNWINVFDENPFIVFTDTVFTIGTLVLLVILVLIKVFEPGPITKYRIAGSIVVYMLLANIWAVVYLYLYEHIEGAFQLTLPAFESNTLHANFMYFSYITITTTGFGEIVPLHPIARAFVQVEAFVGVLYPVILIGRLVSDAAAIKQE